MKITKAQANQIINDERAKGIATGTLEVIQCVADGTLSSPASVGFFIESNEELVAEILRSKVTPAPRE